MKRSKLQLQTFAFAKSNTRQFSHSGFAYRHYRRRPAVSSKSSESPSSLSSSHLHPRSLISYRSKSSNPAFVPAPSLSIEHLSSNRSKSLYSAVGQEPSVSVKKLNSRKVFINYDWCKDTHIEQLPLPKTIEPMKFFYEILTTPTSDTPGTAVLLNFPDKRYFFGQISEGTQRSCVELGVKLQYMSDVFLTGHVHWSNTGGLFGLILTQADAHASAQEAHEESVREKEARGINTANSGPVIWRHGQKVAQRGSLTLHGGKNLTHAIATARRFIFRQGMPLEVKEYCGGRSDLVKQDDQSESLEVDPFEQPSWFDSNIKVWAMSISPSSSSPPTRPYSPKKRSYDELEDSGDTADREQQHVDQLDKDQILRQSIVREMFNSDWKLDALYENKLADVEMPATIFVRNPETKDFERYTGPMPQSGQPLPDIKVYVRKPWPAVAIGRLPPATRSHEALSYVVRNHDFRGKFDPKKARELKVRPGRDYGKLASGLSVVSEEGKTITPDMVLGPTRPGRGMAFIDLPNPEYVDNLVNRPEWKSPSVTTGLDAIVWILGAGVGEHSKLRQFVTSMPHVKHIVSSTDYCPNYLALASAAKLSVRLAGLRNDSYSVPSHDNVTLPQPGTLTAESTATKDAISTSPFIQAQPGLIVNMEPKFYLENSEMVRSQLDVTTLMKKIPRSVEQRILTIRRRIQKPEFKKQLEKLQNTISFGGDTEVITLGTGSSAPSKYRNVSATLVNVPGYGYYLLDCGECTLGQLRRVYEPEALREVLRNLRMIWISHLHADHHLGTVSLIKAWYEVNYGRVIESTKTSSTSSSSLLSYDPVKYDMEKMLSEKRLFLVSDIMMIKFLEEYASVEDFGFEKLVPLSAFPGTDLPNRSKFTFRHVRGDGSYNARRGQGTEEKKNKKKGEGEPLETVVHFDDQTSPIASLLRSTSGLSNLLTTDVYHCRGSLAVSLVFPNGFKLSYSGDCRPSLAFAEIGKDSTLLIHEATFQDNMHGSALAKKHSTMSEALDIAHRMNARTLLLTHFSQRYQKVAIAEGHDHDDNLTQNPSQLENSVDQVDQVQQSSGSNRAEGHDHDDRVRRHGPVPYVGKIPYTVSFDYMRIRVKDIPIEQAYAPAIEKLCAMMEGFSVEYHKQEQRRNLEEKARKPQKKKEQSAGAGAGASIWSASESESGWSDSGEDG